MKGSLKDQLTEIRSNIEKGILIEATPTLLEELLDEAIKKAVEAAAGKHNLSKVQAAQIIEDAQSTYRSKRRSI